MILSRGLPHLVHGRQLEPCADEDPQVPPLQPQIPMHAEAMLGNEVTLHHEGHCT